MGKALGHDDDLVAGNLVRFQGFRDDLFRFSVAVDVGCVPCIETAIVGCFEKG